MANFWDRFRPTKNGGVKINSNFGKLLLQRVGLVSTYSDEVRTFIEKGYQRNDVVYGITNMIAKSAGKARWYIKDSSGNEVQVPLLSGLIASPNPRQTWTDLVQEYMTHKMLTGNGYIAGTYGSGINKEKFFQLEPLPGEDMQIIASNDFKSIRAYKVDFAWAKETELPAATVLHNRAVNPDYDDIDNWLFGQSPFRAARAAIQTYNDSVDAGMYYLQNKGSGRILFNRGDENMSPEAQSQLKDKLRKQNQGPKNNGNVGLIDGVDLDYIDIVSPAGDLLVLEQRMQSAQEICNVINFPSQLIGINNATYQNAKEAKKGFWENCVIPELVELANGLNRWLAPQFGDYEICYDLSHIDALQEDKIMRFQAIKEAAGMITINEARELAGFAPVDSIGEFEGDDMYVGFTQAVVSDQEEISDQNNTNNEENE